MRESSTRTDATNSGLTQGWLVLAAWPPELAFLRKRLPDLPVRVRKRLTLATTGVGMVEAGIAAARLIDQHQPAAVLLVGTAGVYPGQSGSFTIGCAVVARRIALLPKILPGKHDFLPAVVPTEARSTPALARIVRKASGLEFADVACPLGITATAKAASSAAALSGCALENLEAFAVARAAATAKVPFAAILGIANRVGPSGHKEWQAHAKAAAESACLAVLATALATAPT